MKKFKARYIWAFTPLHIACVAQQDSLMDILIEKIELFTSYIEKAAQTFSTDQPLVVPRRLSPEKGFRSS